MQIPKRADEKLKVRDTSPVHLTREGLQRLKDRLARLKASIPELANEAKRTADYGDRSENAEYKDAKGKLRSAHRQILSIEDQIKRAVVIESGPDISGRVKIGSTVVLEAGTAQKIFQIVGPQETDPEKGRISDRSPLGAALLGHAAGDTVNVPTTGGFKPYRILEVR